MLKDEKKLFIIIAITDKKFIVCINIIRIERDSLSIVIK